MGPARPVEYEDTLQYFKIHLPGQSFWAVCRLVFNSKRKELWVPLPGAEAGPLAGAFTCEEMNKNWSRVQLGEIADLQQLKLLLHAGYDAQKAARGRDSQD